MTNYSVCYLDAAGRTKTSEFLPFDSTKSAAAYARIGTNRSPIVEVWREGDLVARIFQPTREAKPDIIDLDAAAVDARALRHQALDDWINEGGSRIHLPKGSLH